MLISHRKKFIFTKTVKTAGTSVESFFEPFCMPEGEWSASHHRDEYISNSGIIGYRGRNRTKETYYHHMPALTIKQNIGDDIWNKYYKFTTIRNPFEKLVSGFLMLERRKKEYSFLKRNVCNLKKILHYGNPLDRIKGESAPERFRHWIQLGGCIQDRDKYIIHDEVCVDFFIRFEFLHQDIKKVCECIDIPFCGENLPEYKKGLRKANLKTCDFYDEETISIVYNIYEWEIKTFGYKPPDA